MSHMAQPHSTTSETNVPAIFFGTIKQKSIVVEAKPWRIDQLLFVYYVHDSEDMTYVYLIWVKHNVVFMCKDQIGCAASCYLLPMRGWTYPLQL